MALILFFFFFASQIDCLFQVGEILGTLIKTFKASFLPFFDELSSYLTPMWVRNPASYPFFSFFMYVCASTCSCVKNWLTNVSYCAPV